MHPIVSGRGEPARGRPDVAVDYFRKRTLEAYPEGLWQQGARYNLARSLEWMGRESLDADARAEAIALYESSDSPQSHGDRLRVSDSTRRP